MSQITALVFVFTLIQTQIFSQVLLGEGQQPQLTVDSQGSVRLVFGDKDVIYYSTSTDQGKTFSSPVVIGKVNEMHLGMSRGPQLASSKDFSAVTAMDKKGNIHCFRLTHKTGQWQKVANVNNVDSSAPEGLMGVSADENNNFYSAWLDLREDRQNNICFATLNGNGKWSDNRFVYKSPEGHVCECCKPSIVVNGNIVSIMFRNWLKGSRDLYLITSADGGKTFSDAQKLGIGTWVLKGCPMDGGGLTINKKNEIHTAWQRDGAIYYAEPGKPEVKIADGRGVGMSGRLVSWEKGSELMVQQLNGERQRIGEGTAVRVYEFDNHSILAVWEKSNRVFFKKL